MAAGVLTAYLGYQSFVPTLTNFLDVLLVIFIPWSAVNLADYFVIRRGAYDVASFFTADGAYARKGDRVTPELFLKLLEEPPSDTQAEDARFRIRLAFFRYLPPETRIRLLDRRRAALAERLEAVKAAIAAAAGVEDDYQRALMEHGRAATEADVAWLAGLIQQERTKYGITAPVGQRRRASATLRRKERTA